MSSTEELQLDLLRETIHYAVRESAYYARAFEGIDLNIAALGDLQRFPLLDRQTLSRHGLDLLVRGCVPEYVALTSGKTAAEVAGQEPLFHFHTEAERSTRAELNALLLGETEGPRPLALRLFSADHGLDYAGGQPGIFALPLEKRYQFQAALAMLRREFGFPGFTARIKILSGTLSLLKLLTLLCMEDEVDSSQFDLELVLSSSWFLTSRWRELIEGYWKAPVAEIYGLSETPGMYAQRCLDCRRYHFSPHAVIELLHIGRDEPVREGVGRLVVSTLYPLAQAQPVIRYDTGDIVSTEGRCPVSGRQSFEFLGRRSDIVWLREGDEHRPLLTPLALNDVLDATPEVAVNESPKTKLLGLRTGYGAQKFAVRQRQEGGAVVVELEVELRWSPLQYPAAARAARAALRQRILEAAPPLAACCEEGRAGVEIKLMEPGSMSAEALY